MSSASGGREYWDGRARQYGRRAAGYLDPLRYQYEEGLRWSAFGRLCPTVPGMRVLDIGCGVGTWCVRLSKLGCRVVGADISPEMIRMAAKDPHVEYHVGAVQDLEFLPETFDLVVSITVLQHIIDEEDFLCALANLRRLLKVGGHAAVLEYSPTSLRGVSRQTNYMRYRSRQQWITAFKDQGFSLARETGVRFIGDRLYAGAVALLHRIRPSLRLVGPDGCPAHLIAECLAKLAKVVDLGLARLPRASALADVHLFLFAKTGNPQ